MSNDEQLENIRYAIESISSSLNHMDYQRQQTLEQLLEIQRNNIDIQRQIELEISGIEYNICRIADALDRLSPAPVTEETPQTPPKREMQWKP